VHLEEIRGKVHFIDTGEEDFAVGAARVRARSVPHRGRTFGYRIEGDGASLVYLPDHQAPEDQRTVPQAVLELCDGADLLIHDSQYSDEEFAQKHDWGHSTIGYAVRVAAEAGVRQLALFHHDPAHSDMEIDRLLAQARRVQPVSAMETIAAREGLTIELSRP
jgi:ribonuclease BN (tRNA processing enzyme)